MNKKSVLIIAGLILITTAGATWYYLGLKKEAAPLLSEVVVTKGNIELNILSTGVVEPLNRLEIKPPIAGRVEEVLVVEGEDVKRGQILAWMSSTERAALLDAARARGQAEVKKWSSYYKATPVISPINGSIIARSVETGQSFTASDAILVMADSLSVKAQVDETDLSQITLNGAAVVTLDAYRNTTLQAKVVHIAYEATTVNNVTTYGVDVQPLDPPEFMRSGMTANISFVTDKRENILLVPSEAIKMENKSYVLVAAKDGPKKRFIETGISDGKNTEVLSGLKEGDKVLVQGLVLPEAAEGGFNPFGRSRRGKK